MVDKLQTNPPAKPESNERSTAKIDSVELNIDLHDQYLDQLHRQYNVEINHAILFYVEDQIEPVIFVDKDKIVVGRQDKNGRIRPEFDVTQFDGASKGVSRMHAKIARDGDKYLIEDLASTNGTRLNGNKLVPYQYATLTDGAILQFGRLVMNVFIIRRD